MKNNKQKKNKGLAEQIIKEKVEQRTLPSPTDFMRDRSESQHEAEILDHLNYFFLQFSSIKMMSKVDLTSADSANNSYNELKQVQEEIIQFQKIAKALKKMVQGIPNH
jgi:hypothetical protein